MTTWVLPIVAGACTLAVIVVAATNAPARRLAIGYATGRRAPAGLVGSGIVFATAMVVSAALVGDSLRASIRSSVVEQLGPIDEEVVRPGVDPVPVNAAIVHRQSADVAGTLPVVAMVATVRGRDFVARVSQA